VVCLECGGRNHDAAHRCGRCGVQFVEARSVPKGDEQSWEYSEMKLDLPRLRWFQLPNVWLPAIAECLGQVSEGGWQAVHEVDVPALVAVGGFRRGEARVDRAAHADRVVLKLRRRIRQPSPAYAR
jgi:hypothetical protein